MTKASILAEMNIKISTAMLHIKDYIRAFPEDIQTDYLKGKLDAYEDVAHMIAEYYHK